MSTVGSIDALCSVLSRDFVSSLLDYSLIFRRSPRILPEFLLSLLEHGKQAELCPFHLYVE